MIFVLARFLRRAPEELSVEDLKALKDEDLMGRFARGDVAAFELLVERHERPVYRFVLRSVRDDERAEELTQDVFLRVVNNAARYKPSAKFTTWLYTIARNACIDEARRRGRRPTVSLNAPDLLGGLESCLSYNDTVAPSSKSERSSVMQPSVAGYNFGP